jgi:hypothetical protein
MIVTLKRKTQLPFFENPCPAPTSGIIGNNESCLDILYDKDDLIAVCDDAITHESPIFFLKSPIYTIEEKYAFVQKYPCGLQLSYGKSNSSHDTIKNGINNYFERGKHANECHNKFDDPLYFPKISKMHDLNNHFVKFSSSNCNYYERGGYECPLYETNNYKLHLTTVDALLYSYWL